MNLKEIIMGAAVLSVFVGLQIGVFTDHISHFSGESVNTEKLEKLQKLDNISQKTDVSRQNALGVEARSNYFNLPGIVQIFKMPLETLQVYQVTIPVIGDTLNIPQEVSYLGILFLTLTAIFRFARKNK